MPNMKICISAGIVLSTPPLCLTNCLLLRISVSPYKGSSKKKQKQKTILYIIFCTCYIHEICITRNGECASQPVFNEQRTNQERNIQFMKHCKMNHNHLFMEEVCIRSVCILLQKPVPLDLLNMHL